MQWKSLWIKASANCINVNVNLKSPLWWAVFALVGILVLVILALAFLAVVTVFVKHNCYGKKRLKSSVILFLLMMVKS